LEAVGENMAVNVQELPIEALSSNDLVARKLAGSHRLSPSHKTKINFARHLNVVENLMEDGYRHFRHASDTELLTSSAAEWMLDNYYIVKQTIKQIREDMPRKYFLQLPKLASPHEFVPRIYSISNGYVNAAKGQFDVGMLEGFIQQYQKITTLTIGELWALPTMMRLSILECLIGAVAGVTGKKNNYGFALIREDFGDWIEEEMAIPNLIISSHRISTLDWKEFFENDGF
jgi:hypothetical protein